MKKVFFAAFSLLMCFCFTSPQVIANPEAKGPSADNLRGIDRAGQRGGHLPRSVNEEDDPFLDGLSGRGFKSVERRDTRTEKNETTEDSTNFPEPGAEGNGDGVDYHAGMSFDDLPELPKEKLTLDDPVDPPTVNETADDKEQTQKPLDDSGIDYHVGLSFGENNKVKKPELTYDAPLTSPDAEENSGYDPNEDEAPDGELGDGESIL